DAQKFSDVERTSEILIKNCHQYLVDGGKESLNPSKLRKIANLGNCNNSKLEFGSFWELFGEATKSVKLENTVQGS
ncbi:hypothetical protein FD755_024232, partial [Muntiacus reevesi]